MGILIDDNVPLGWVLVVEDDVALSHVLKTELEKQGFRVVTATSAPEATAKIRNQEFNCIILDMELRRGTGEDVIGTLNSTHPSASKIPIIVTSGTLDESLVRRLVKDVRDIMVKPYNVQAVVQRVQEKIRLT